MEGVHGLEIIPLQCSRWDGEEEKLSVLQGETEEDWHLQ